MQDDAAMQRLPSQMGCGAKQASNWSFFSRARNRKEVIMHKDKHIRVRGVRSEPGIRRLSRALIALTQAQAEKEAELQRAQNKQRPKKDRKAS
jgi:hypothetical protein